MKERGRNPELLSFLPESCTLEELSTLFLTNAAAINAYCGQDIVPALKHFAAEDPIPSEQLSDTDLYPVIKFNNFSVPLTETAGPEGKTVFRVNPRELIESLVRAIESVDEAFGLDPYMVTNWRPLLKLSELEHFTFDVFAIPLMPQVYLCPALRWDRQTTPVDPRHLKGLLEIIRGEEEE